MRYGPYDFPERTMYEKECWQQMGKCPPGTTFGCECHEGLNGLGRVRSIQLGQTGPVASTAIGVGLGAAYGAAIGAVAGGSGRRGKGALYGAATGAAINLVMNVLGVVFFTKD